MHPCSSGARVLAGALVSSFGVALNERSDFGLGALFVLQEGVSAATSQPFGAAVVAVGLGLALTAALLGERPGVGSVAAIVLVGLWAHPAAAVVPEVHATGLRWAFLLVSPLVMAFGGALVATARVGVDPLNAVMFGLYARLPGSLRAIRLVMEATMALVGLVLGGRVGVGCVVIALAIGPCVQLWLRVLGAEPPKPAPTAERPAAAAAAELGAPAVG